MKSVRFVRVLCAIVISCINAKEAENTLPKSKNCFRQKHRAKPEGIRGLPHRAANKTRSTDNGCHVHRVFTRNVINTTLKHDTRRCTTKDAKKMEQCIANMSMQSRDCMLF